MREIKFRVFKTFGLPGMKMDYNPVIYKGMYCDMDGSLICDTYESDSAIVMQYTGLKDANGKEIYEFMELNNRWEVDWLKGRYILRDISNGDIIDLDYENTYEITREYTKI